MPNPTPPPGRDYYIDSETGKIIPADKVDWSKYESVVMTPTPAVTFSNKGVNNKEVDPTVVWIFLGVVVLILSGFGYATVRIGRILETTKVSHLVRWRFDRKCWNIIWHSQS